MDGRAVDGTGGVGLAVAAGGGIGAALRFTLAGGAAQLPYPAATFAVNVAGSLALGALTGVLARRGASPALRGFLLTGLCGGFTTFAAFEYDTLALLQHGAYGTAALYALGSVLACVAGVLAGLRLTARLPRR
jgi:CrcB protein